MCRRETQRGDEQALLYFSCQTVRPLGGEDEKSSSQATSLIHLSSGECFRSEYVNRIARQKIRCDGSNDRMRNARSAMCTNSDDIRVENRDQFSDYRSYFSFFLNHREPWRRRA